MCQHVLENKAKTLLTTMKDQTATNAKPSASWYTNGFTFIDRLLKDTDKYINWKFQALNETVL